MAYEYRIDESDRKRKFVKETLSKSSFDKVAFLQYIKETLTKPNFDKKMLLKFIKEAFAKQGFDNETIVQYVKETLSKQYFDKEMFLQYLEESVAKPSTDKELFLKYKNAKFLKNEMFISPSKFKPYEKKGQWVFLSHSFKDFHSVRLLRNILEGQGLYPIMFFLKCLDDDDELDSLIKREIRSRTNFILCDSDNSRASKWVQKEVQFIKQLNRNYEIIDISKIRIDENDADEKIHQLARRTTLYLSFDNKYEGIAYAMFLRLKKYDFNLILHPLYDFKEKQYYQCVTGKFTELMDSGIVAVIIGDWILYAKNPNTVELLSAIEKNRREESLCLLPLVLEQSIDDIISKDPMKRILSGQYYSYCNKDVYDRVDYAVNQILSKMLTPSSMILSIEVFRDKNNEKYDLVEAARLTELLFKEAKMDNAGDLIALGKCYERGWGCDKDLEKALQCYTKAQDLVGFNAYKEDILDVEQQIEDSLPKEKLSFWKKLVLFLRSLFWPFD